MTQRKLLAIYIAVALALFAVLFVQRTSEAHGNNYDPDENNDGIVQVYVGMNTHGNYGTYLDKANRQLANHNIPKRIKRVDNKANAEVIYSVDSSLGKCNGAAYSHWNGVDHIYFASGCYGLGLISHETAHVFGLFHHDCTLYWQSHSVMVVELNSAGEVVGGCKVTIYGFGSHDLSTLETKDWTVND
jgi:hypothetical protein